MLSLLAATAMLIPSELRLASLFADHMVIQRGMRVPVFGTANPGQDVEVEIVGQRYRTKANDRGRWILRMNPMTAGGPYTMFVRGDKVAVIKDVMVGEVWLASGQSNMEWRVAWATDPEKDLINADPAIRFFTVGRQSSETPTGDVSGSWQPSSRQSVFQFSAVAYSFAKELFRNLKVPIGIIHSSWGGTPAESWMDRSCLMSEPSTAPLVKDYLASLSTFQARRLEYERKLELYNATVSKKDPGNKGYHQGWAEPSADERDWQKVIVPGAWETRGIDMDGSAWYRKTIDLPDQWYGRELRLELGTIDDLDTTYINGNRIGYTDEKVRDPSKLKRVYRVAPGVVRRGRNVVTVRVFDRFGDGGFTGDSTDMKLSPVDGQEWLSLDGEWAFRIEKKMESVTPAVVNDMPASPPGPGHPQAPGGLWNGMIAPLTPYGIKGVIWYQGESNAPRANQYRTLFPMLIKDWRKRWGQGDYPFYYVQLANFRARKTECSESDWAELREAQLMALKLPRTGMAVAIDLGDTATIHPKNKREVGRRLALNALAKDYAIPVLRTGPLYQSVRIEGKDAQVFFSAVGDRLQTSDGARVRGFAVAGADRKFIWAEARISGSSVVVSSPRVSRPVAVRYAWADNPDCNLVNSARLPASPFRTDDWPGVTR